MEETHTSALVASRLREWGIDVTESVGKVLCYFADLVFRNKAQ